MVDPVTANVPPNVVSPTILAVPEILAELAEIFLVVKMLLALTFPRAVISLFPVIFPLANTFPEVDISPTDFVLINYQ